MTQKDDKSKNPRPDSAQAKPEPLDKGSAPIDESKTVPPSVRPSNFVFKIVKADPKNTSNFEDVADK